MAAIHWPYPRKLRPLLNYAPRFLARTRHGYFDQNVIWAELEPAGFSGVMIETVENKVAPHRLGSQRWLTAGNTAPQEIEARRVLKEASGHAALSIQQRHGSGEVSAKK